MSKIELADVTNINSVTTINANFDKIEKILQDKVLFRDNPEGEPNAILQNIDINGKRLINVDNIDFMDGGSVASVVEINNVLQQTLVARDEAVAAKDNAVGSASSSADSSDSSFNYMSMASMLYVDFDKRFLGAKTSDPLVDNQNSVLQPGALYLNTSAVPNKVRVYNGTTWQDLAAYTSTTTTSIDPSLFASIPDVDAGTSTTKVMSPYHVKYAIDTALASLTSDYANTGFVNTFFDNNNFLADVSVGGALNVTGASTLSGNTSVGGTLGVTGSTNFSGAVHFNVQPTGITFPAGGGSGGLLNVQEFKTAGTFTFTKTPGATKYIVEIQAGGGNAGKIPASTDTNTIRVGTSGQTGGYAKIFTTKDIDGATIQVGQGSSTWDASGNGRYGQDSFINKVGVGRIICQGGGGGRSWVISSYPSFLSRQASLNNFAAGPIYETWTQGTDIILEHTVSYTGMFKEGSLSQSYSFFYPPDPSRASNSQQTTITPVIFSTADTLEYSDLPSGLSYGMGGTCSITRGGSSVAAGPTNYTGQSGIVRIWEYA